MRKYSEAERSIVKTYRKELWAKFVHGISDYDMIKDGDCIACCISGGKDSFLLAKCMQELKRHNKFHFELKFIVMNPGYNKENLDKIISNAKYLNIPITIFNSNIFSMPKRQ